MAVVNVFGADGKENSVLYHCPPDPTGHVIYFPGDTQDLQDNMEAMYHDISQWSPWSLERTRDILREKFPSSAVWLIRPHTLLRHLFSCYHNFVDSSTIVGVPIFNAHPRAIPHLYQLLKNLVHHHHLQEGDQQVTMSVSEESMLMLPLTLIGFSKGCVVLNQIIHELTNYFTIPDQPSSSELTTTDTNGATSGAELEVSQNPKPMLASSVSGPAKSDLINFLKRIESIYWLDSGHSGEEECWVTDKDLLAILAVLRPVIHVHVTPHQMKCPQRPWICEEEKLFVSILRELSIDVRETHHFQDERRSLSNHFKVLNVF